MFINHDAQAMLAAIVKKDTSAPWAFINEIDAPRDALIVASIWKKHFSQTSVQKKIAKPASHHDLQALEKIDQQTVTIDIDIEAIEGIIKSLRNSRAARPMNYPMPN